jgi:hypothetical protein
MPVLFIASGTSQQAQITGFSCYRPRQHGRQDILYIQSFRIICAIQPLVLSCIRKTSSGLDLAYLYIRQAPYHHCENASHETPDHALVLPQSILLADLALCYTIVLSILLAQCHSSACPHLSWRMPRAGECSEHGPIFRAPHRKTIPRLNMIQTMINPPFACSLRSGIFSSSCRGREFHEPKTPAKPYPT